MKGAAVGRDIRRPEHLSFGKRPAEGRAAPDRSIWEDTVYWGCWIILAALAAWMMAVRLGGA